MRRLNGISFATLGALAVALCAVTDAPAWAAAPFLYSKPAYESPVRGDPGDLLLIPGYGLSAADVIVYKAIADTTQPPAQPSSVPTTSTATQGILDLVSSADAPYSLAVHLPTAMITGQTYALWLRAPGGQWSAPLLINDARPLWVTPDSAYRFTANSLHRSATCRGGTRMGAQTRESTARWAIPSPR